jgi:hypothetical protein
LTDWSPPMREQEMNNFLFKLSIEVFHYIAEGSNDPFRLHLHLWRIGSFRAMVYSVQLMGVETCGSQTTVSFALSPNYLFENLDLVDQFDLNRLKWDFVFPAYGDHIPASRETDSIEEQDGDYEDTLANWLLEGEVQIQVLPNLTDLSIETLAGSMNRA